MKIGQEIIASEDEEIITYISKNVFKVKKGDKGIVLGNGNVRYITGEARGREHLQMYVTNGYDYLNISKIIMSRLNVVFGLENFLEDEEIKASDMIEEIEDVLVDIL